METVQEPETRPLLLTTGKRPWLVGLSISLGVTLASGFTATAHHYGSRLAHLISDTDFAAVLAPYWAAPVLSLFFFLTMNPFTRRSGARFSLTRALSVSAGPLLIAVLFGCALRYVDGAARYTHWQLLWTLVSVPIMEEFLFRGWMFELVGRLFRGRWFTLTNPFSPEIWATAIAFSLWHVQNLQSEPPGIVVFQVSYTFFAGFWLGTLREMTGRVWPCVVAHAAVNAATLLPRLI